MLLPATQERTGKHLGAKRAIPALLFYYFTFIIKKMAQLHVQKKRNRLGWLWILLILIIAAVVYYLLVRNNVVPDTFGLKQYDTTFIAVDNNSELT